ncbi:hypothetical protein FO519_007876 [Halicephalobus sp. NKZ332]|nr:hypothetical protein FO519_007876 [Halicephalobus sp. NKZ332]
MSHGTSIDREIAEIRLALRNLHETLYKISFKMENATGILDEELRTFDQDVINVANEVSHIKDNTYLVTGLFPQNSTYLATLLVLDALIWILAFFLIYKIIQHVKQRSLHSQKWQEKFSAMKRTFRPDLLSRGKNILIAQEPESGQVVRNQYEPLPPRKDPPSYRSVLIRNPPPSYRNQYEDEAGSLLDEIAPDRRKEWTRIVDELDDVRK